MDEYLLIVCRAPRTVNSRRHRCWLSLNFSANSAGALCVLCGRRLLHLPWIVYAFVVCRTAQTRYDSQRAGTGEEEGAVLRGGGAGGSWPEPVTGCTLSRGSGRLTVLRQHCGKLAAARRLRHHKLRRDCADSLAVAWISGVPGGDLLAIRGRELPRRPAGASAVRLGHMLPDRGH